jgi:hypothetical protein
MYSFNIVADVEYNPSENVKYERKAHGQKRRIDEEQANLRDGNIKLFSQVRTHTKRVSFEKSNYPL